MRVQAMTIPAAAGRAHRGAPPARLLLAALTILALPLAFLAAGRVPAAPVDPDLVRVIRFMALLKGASPWRLWPAASGVSAGPPDGAASSTWPDRR